MVEFLSMDKPKVAGELASYDSPFLMYSSRFELLSYIYIENESVGFVDVGFLTFLKTTYSVVLVSEPLKVTEYILLPYGLQ